MPQQATQGTPVVTAKQGEEVLQGVMLLVGPALFALSYVHDLFRWLFLVLAIGSVVLMWMRKAFAPSGRMVLTAIYGALAALAVITMLSGSGLGNTGSPPPNNSGSNYGNPNTQAGFGQTVPPTADPFMANEPPAAPVQMSGAEQALREFLNYWRESNTADMIKLTTQTWQNSSSSNSESMLFFAIKNRSLVNYRIENVSGNDSDGSRTITAVLTVRTATGSELDMRYQIIMESEGGYWRVNPNSLSSGQEVQAYSGGDDIVSSSAAFEPLPDDYVFVSPTPTLPPTANLTLYYNKNGGKLYHVQAECPSVDKKYFPLASFTYGKLGEKAYKGLSPCPTCKAPARPN